MHGDKNESLETCVLKAEPLGRVSQEHLVLWRLTSTAPGTHLRGQSETVLICEHLSSCFVLPAVAIGSTWWPHVVPSGRRSHILSEGCEHRLTRDNLVSAGERLCSSASANVDFVTAILSSLRVNAFLKWWWWWMVVCALCIMSGVHLYHDVFPLQFCKKKRGKKPRYLLFALLPAWHWEVFQEDSVEAASFTSFHCILGRKKSVT